MTGVVVAVIGMTGVQAQQLDLGGLFKALGGGGAETGEQVQVVNFRELKKLLPEKLNGMRRTMCRGEKQSTMGITASTAEATYGDKAGNSVDVKITDVGSLSGLAAMAYAGWANMEIDEESDGGFERTVMYGEFKAMEKYDSDNQSSEIQVLLGNRFTVEASGNGVDFTVVQKAVKSIDLKALSNLQ